MGMNLRPYQQDAVDGLRDAFRQGCRAPVLQLPTGGGKTIIFCHIAKSAALKNNNVLILVHRRELINQTSIALSKLSLEHGIIAPKHKPNQCLIQIASVQTLVRRLETLEFKPALIIIDEAHHAIASTWETILLHFNRSKLLGVTATPERLDGKGLKEHFDKLILGPSVKDLINNFYLSDLKVYTLPYSLSRKIIKVKNNDFDARDSAQHLEDAGTNGDAVTEYTKRCPNKPAIVFCCDIRHAVGMAKRFTLAGYKAASLVSKGVSPEQRKQMIEDLGNGNLDILTSVDIVSEGTDIPIVTAAILLRPTESLTIYLQQVGRVLRKAPGKEFAIIIDCVGNVAAHGMPQQEREWSLEGTNDQARSVFICESCFVAFERASREWPVICPECGHKHWPDEREPKPKPEEILPLIVDLIEVTESNIAITKQSKKQLIAQANTLKDCIEIGKQLGYKPGWAHIIWKEKQTKSIAECAPPASPKKHYKFNMSEIMQKAGIPEPPWSRPHV